jgi:hypothetical protein
MNRPVCVYLVFTLLVFGSICKAQAHAGPDPDRATLLAGEEYVGTIDHDATRYLKITLTNLAEEAAVCRIAFYRKRIELGEDRVGPVEFRTFTLEQKNDSQTRIWTTLNFDEFTLNVETGSIQVIVAQAMDIQ